MFSAQNISKHFPGGTVIGPLDLKAEAGEVILVTGANGSGKTTTFRIAAGLLRPTTGTINVTGRRDYAGHATMLFPQLTVAENLRLFIDNKQSCEQALSSWQLSSLSQRTLGTLSKGQQARAALCRAFESAPSVLLLDEPSSNLDDRSCELLTSRIAARRSARQLTLIATHDLARLLKVADRMVVLEAGKARIDAKGTAIAQAAELYRSINR